MISLLDLDRIAAAITADLLVPYVPPARPFTLGTPSTFGLPPGYVSREAAVAGQPTPLAGLERLAEAIRRALGEPHVVATSDRTLERALDPRPLLAPLREARIAVISATLRRFSVGDDDTGPPVDPGCVRAWTLPELQAWLEAMGFEALFGGTLPPDPAAPGETIGALVISAHTPAAMVTRVAP